MTKQLSTQDAFNLGGSDGKLYIVILTGIKNDVNGNRRYEATIVQHNDLWNRGKSGAFRYHFTGHMMTPQQEAEWALEQIHLKK